MNYAIEIKNLSKKFGKNEAVQNLDLKVPEGSIFAFLGPNGAGKTTTIKMMMNIISPSKGEAKVLDVNTTQLGPKEFEQIGYVSENQEMPEWMRVGQFLNYCKTMYPSWDDQFCSELIKQFNLSLKQKIKNLSRGMKMKVSLISSLAYRPKLLIFDEPFSGLDPLVRDEFISGVLDITGNEKWTIFISSHDIDEVERLADWVGIIDSGKLKLVEKTEELQARFRRVELFLDEAVDPVGDIPKEWLLLKHKDRAVNFIDSQFSETALNETIKQIFPRATNIQISGMTLKEIFIALAREYRTNQS